LIRFSEKETKFLESIEEARLATANKSMPHVKPVSFLFRNGAFYVATDYSTRTFKNVKDNPNAAITVDVYRPGGHKAVLAQGKVALIEEGDEFKKIYAEFFEKFEWVRRDPWKEKEAPFLKIIPATKASWGLA